MVVRKPTYKKWWLDFQHLENLDALLQSMGKQREVVEGAGDCQYLEKGLQLGSMLEVLALVHPTLAADPERYAPWVAEEEYWAFVGKVLQRGTWGDDITLQVRM